MRKHFSKYRRMKIFNLLLFLSFLLIQPFKATSQVSSAQIDSIVRNAMNNFAVAGMAVVVVKDGKIIHKKGYGVKNINTGKKVDSLTNFAIASNSKAFTTTLLSLLVEEHKLSWKDKVVDIIPEFRMYNDYTTMNFNIEDLVTHRSGLGLGMGDLMFFPDGADFSIKDILKNFQYFTPVSAFRTKFDYDNLLYLVAGEVIKRVSGKSWEDFVKERIFMPLKMDSTYASINYIPKGSNLAEPHLNQGKKIWVTQPERWDPKKINGAAGGIYSNVNDLSKWLLVQLNHGKYGVDLSKQLFNAKSQRNMWQIHTVLPVNNSRYNSHFAGYGLGWFLTDVDGKMMVSHTGGLMGMLSKTLIIPDLNLGIIILTNTYLDGAGVFSSVSQSIMDKYLQKPSFDWVKYYSKVYHQKSTHAQEVVNEVWKKVKNSKKKKIDVDKYTGTFKDAWFGKIKIEKQGDKLWFQSMRSPKLKGSMFYYGGNTFVVKWKDRGLLDADAFVIFELNEKGRAEAFKMKGISPAIDFSYDFQDLHPVKLQNQ